MVLKNINAFLSMEEKIKKTIITYYLAFLLEAKSTLVPSASACSSLPRCLNFIVPRCITEATILYTLSFSSLVNPSTSMQFFNWKKSFNRFQNCFKLLWVKIWLRQIIFSKLNRNWKIFDDFIENNYF